MFGALSVFKSLAASLPRSAIACVEVPRRAFLHEARAVGRQVGRSAADHGFLCSDFFGFRARADLREFRLRDLDFGFRFQDIAVHLQLVAADAEPASQRTLCQSPRRLARIVSRRQRMLRARK